MVYLDYAATCPVIKYPQQLYRNVLGEGYFFNPNANYAYKEKRLLVEAENRVKRAIGAKGGKVIFGGTSSQLIENLITAVNSAHDKDEYNVYCSCYEHDSFFRYRNNELLGVSELDTVFDISNERPQSIVMWQAVNNITGQIFPAKQIGEFIHNRNGFYICDGTPQIGHTPTEPNIDDWCDFWCCSGHKAGTELGIGCCWISDRLDEWLNGFKLPGTPNLAGALAMTQAVEDACDNVNIECHNKHWVALYKYLVHNLIDNQIKFETIDIGGCGTHCVAINAIRLPGFNADALQQYLASKQIYVSIGGSACAEKHDFRILETGYHLTKEEAGEVIRVSFGENSTPKDIEALVKNICEFKKTYLDN